MTLTKSQVDKLGERLRSGRFSEGDLRLLDDYRRSFSAAYEHVIGVIRDELRHEITGRPAKSTTSVVDKLQRESIRLTQMQDIAGCRLVISDTSAQDIVVEQLQDSFATAQIVDRRNQPSHGYRAVHVIAESAGRWVEIQVRTSLQHLWAELSEKCSDVIDPAIKYGGGDRDIQTLLIRMSHLVKDAESREMTEQGIQIAIDGFPDNNPLSVELQSDFDAMRNNLTIFKGRLATDLRALIMRVAELRGPKDAFPDSV